MPLSGASVVLSAGPAGASHPSGTEDSVDSAPDDTDTFEDPASEEGRGSHARRGAPRDCRSRSPRRVPRCRREVEDVGHTCREQTTQRPLPTPVRTACRLPTLAGSSPTEASLLVDTAHLWPPSVAVRAVELTAAGEDLIANVVAVLARKISFVSEPCGRAASPNSSCGYPLKLAESIGPRVFSLEASALPFASGSAHPFELAVPWTPFQPTTQLEGFALHPSTRAALSLCVAGGPSIHCDAAPHLQLYVDGSAKGGDAAWAVAVVLQDFQGQQTHFVSTLGEDDFNPLQAEQCAVCWGLLWFLQFIPTGPKLASCTVMYDCQAAGGAASGETSGPRSSPLSDLARGIAQVIETWYGGLLWQHTPAHNAHPWNELVDVLAKTLIGIHPMPVQGLSQPPSTVAGKVREVSWAWGWLHVTLPTSTAFPTIDHGCMLWNNDVGSSSLQGEDLVPTVAGSTFVEQEGKLSLRVFSMNVQSLKGKHKLFEEQARHHRVDVLCMQETHTNDDFLETRYYHRFASPCSQHWGNALWVGKRMRIGGEPIAIASEHLHQVLAKPRLLLVLLRLSAFTALLGSVHLPQKARGPEERAEVLADLGRALHNLHGVDFVALGVDANARLPCHVAGVTGDVDFEQADECGEDFSRFLRQHALYAPSTFSSCHEGPSFTWQHARGHQSRIDYIVVRAVHQVAHELSWTSLTFDALTSNIDHWCVAWQGDLTIRVEPRECKRLIRPRYDRQKLLSREGQCIVREELQAFHSPAWCMHPDDHAECLANRLREILDQHFTARCDGPRATYISEEIWTLRSACIRLKKRTRKWNEGYVRHVLQETILAWRRCAELPGTLFRLLFLRELFASAVKFAQGRVKLMIRNEKRVKLHAFLRSLGGMRLQDLQKALKTFGVGGRRNRRQQRPVPRLKHANGEAIVGRHAVNQAWLDFFGHQEGGTKVDMDSFVQECCDDRPASFEDLDITVLPTLLEVETSFRTTASHKAFGLDALPPEIFQANPTVLGKLYMPLFMKCAVHCRQPSQRRGGILFPLTRAKAVPKSLPTTGRCSLGLSLPRPFTESTANACCLLCSPPCTSYSVVLR